MNRKHFVIALCTLVLASIACNFPFITSPTPIVFPTPDLTMTAVFNPTLTSPPVIFPTQTSLPAWVSPTPTLTGQLPSPTSTETPPPPTPTPTTTATPTVSYAGPDKRPKFSMQAYYLDQKPTIDGSLEEWDLERARIESVVFGKSNYDGVEDISGRAMIGWDSKRLYIGIRVLDDKYVQNSKGKNLYKGDSLDFLLDADVSSDYYLGAMNGDDYQIGISPGNPSPNEEREAYLWYPKADEGKLEGVTIAARSKEDGYVVEASIPWKLFGIDPQEDQHYGFAFSISDNDNRQQNVQQSMVSYVPIRTLTDPRTWGDLTLVKP